MNPTSTAQLPELPTSTTLPDGTTIATPPQLSNGSPVVTTPTPTASTTASNAFVNSLTTGDASTGLESVGTLQGDVSTAKSDVSSNMSEIKSIMGQLGMQSQDTQQLQSQYDIQGNVKELQNLNLQLTQKQNAYKEKYAKLENQAIPMEFITGQVAATQRQEAFDVGALASVISAKQGNLELANQQIKDAIDQKYQPLKDLYSRKLDFYNMNRDVLSAADKKLADRQAAILQGKQKAIDTQIQQEQDSSKIINDAIGNGAPSSMVEEARKHLNDPLTVASMLAKYSKDPQDVALKQAQIAQIWQNISDSKASNPTAKAEQEKLVAQSGLLDNVSLVDSILGDPNLSNVVGMKTPGAWFGGFGANMFGTKSVPALNKIKQLQGLLALENRAKLKGSGAISDFEARTLERSSSSFSRGLSNKDAVTELNKIRGVFATSAGLNANVKITDPSTGKSQIVSANRGGIEQAIIDGLTVEYQ